MKKDKILNYIREQIPELKELSFGCEVELGGERYTCLENYKEGFYYYGKYKGVCSEYVDTTENTYFKIIGHPVELRHLLMCMRKTTTIVYAIDEYGNISEIGERKIFGEYDLSKTLEQNLTSNEELADFIINILNIK